MEQTAQEEMEPTEEHAHHVHSEGHPHHEGHPGHEEHMHPEGHTHPMGKREENTVYVGKKGTMSYVLAVVTQFNNGANEVTVKARGKLISRAVDVVEIVRHRFMPSAKIHNIAISTEELASEDGSMNKVSSIEIKVEK